MSWKISQSAMAVAPASVIMLLMRLAAVSSTSDSPTGEASGARPASFECFECVGRTGDGQCGTPFSASGLRKCNGTACVVVRKLVDITQGAKSYSSASTCGSWALMVDSSYRGGWADKSLLVLNCLEACVQRPGCASIDWKPFKVSGENCVMHGPATDVDLVTEKQSYHFDLTRTPDTCLPCGPQWFSTPNMAFTDGVASEATRLKDCMSACIDDVKCSAIDFNVNRKFGERCTLVIKSFTAQYATSTGSTHYDLYRRPPCHGQGGGGFEVISRNCSQSWWRQRRSCRQLPGVKFGIDCSCSGNLCNNESNSLITNEYLVVRELFFDELFDIIEESSPIGRPVVSWKKTVPGMLSGWRSSGSSWMVRDVAEGLGGSLNWRSLVVASTISYNYLLRFTYL